MVRRLVLFAVFISLLFVNMQEVAYAAMDHGHVSHAEEMQVHDVEDHQTQSTSKHDNQCLDCCNNHCQHMQWLPQNGKASYNLAYHQRISIYNQFFSGLIHSPDSPPPNIL